MTLNNIVIGLLLIAAGLVMLRFNKAIGNTLGAPQMLTRFFGPGREYGLYLLLAFVVMFAGMAIMFNLFDSIGNAIFQPFRGLVK